MLPPGTWCSWLARTAIKSSRGMRLPSNNNRAYSRNLRALSKVIAARRISCRAVSFLEQLLHARDVLGRIHADGIVFHFGYPDLPAVLQPAQLLELLDLFQFPLRQGRIFQQGIALKNVQAEMF